MSGYTVPCLVVHRTANRQEAMTGTGFFRSKHDRLGTVSGCWKLDQIAPWCVATCSLRQTARSLMSLA